jgi:hypothetical protein
MQYIYFPKKKYFIFPVLQRHLLEEVQVCFCVNLILHDFSNYFEEV